MPVSMDTETHLSDEELSTLEADRDEVGIVNREATSMPTCPNGTSNLALGKSTSQSSTRHGGVSSRAVDGNTNGQWSSGSVTHTNNNWRSWWQVDLGDVYHIDEITLWNRSDCCSNRLSNFYVFVSDTPFTSNDPSTTASQLGVWSTFQTNHPVYSDTFSPGRTGRYVRVQLTSNSPLSLAEVEVRGCSYPFEICDNGIDDDGDGDTDMADLDCVCNLPLDNVAIGKTASQHSINGGRDASNAVDGNTYGGSSSQITATNNVYRPWWEVDLGSLHNISKVVIWNRTDCCTNQLSDFYLQLSDDPFQSTDLDLTLNQGDITSIYIGPRPSPFVETNPSRTARYVRIQLNGTDPLNLAEVEIFGCDLPDEICGNGIDDDRNGLIDCEDLACSAYFDHIVLDDPDNCPILDNGSITIDTLIPHFNYSIDNGSTFQESNQFTGLSEGSYSLRIINENSNCIVDSIVQITDPICPIMVENTNDSGTGSLREAIDLAYTGDYIAFDSTIWGSVIYLDSVLNISKGINILGDPDYPMVISGEHRRVHTLIEVDSDTHVELKNITLQSAVAGIHNFSSLSIENVSITNCEEGIMNTDTMILDRCGIVSNMGSRRAGGILNLAGAMQITNSIIAGNSGLEAGGILNSSTIRLTNAVITGNLAHGVSRCGIGRCEGGGILSTDSLIMLNSTVASNTGRLGSVGIQFEGYASLTNSIVALNTRPGEEPSQDILPINANATLVSNSNLVGDASGTELTIDSVLVGDAAEPIDPMFYQVVSEIPDAGGNYSLLCTSPAIDTGDIMAVPHIEYDIIGNYRYEGHSVDLGAYEVFCCTSEPIYSAVIIDHDLDNDGIPDRLDQDDDGDGVPDNVDLDDDNDGISDCEERGNEDALFWDLFNLAGDAVQISDGEIRLTTSTPGQAGSAFSVEKVDFSQDFYFTFEANLGSNNGSGADGIAIVYHNDPAGSQAVGQTGLGLGALGIQNGIVLELDDWDNGGYYGDISADHGMIWNSENNSSSGRLTSAISLGNIEDGQWHSVSISWIVSTQTISYTVDGQVAGTYTGDLINQLFDGSNLVHFGFTASTGAAYNDQRIRFSGGFCDFPTFVDTDNDGVENYLDTDSDGDRCSDTDEYYNDISADSDDNGMYGTGTPQVSSNGMVIGASYSGDYSNVSDICTSICRVSND